ncbi:MAG: sulfite exporter TauE/SafE family protein [Ktedonobacterales bacterium]|nr:sulfite exporter TauE/SafE family protein [Ktedonobacterales bacterium]
MDARLTLVGLLVGVLVGLTGIGGSAFTTPLLILVLGVKPLIAVGTDLLYSVPTKLLGAVIHRRQGTVDASIVWYLALGGVPGALAGILSLGAVRALVSAETLNTVVQRGVGIVLLVAAAVMVFSPIVTRIRERRGGGPPPQGALATPRWRLVALGAIVGIVVSLSSIGSGSLTLPALGLLAPKLGLRQRVGSDVAFASLLVPVAAAGHLSMGDVNIGMALNLLAGSLPGVFLGSKLCRYLPDAWMRPTVAGVLVLAAARLL